MNFIERAKFLGLEYFSALILVVLSLLSTVTEVFGVGIFLPIFQFISADGDVGVLVSDSQLWEHIVKFYRYIGLDVSLIVLLVTTLTLFIMRQIFTYVRLIYLSIIRQDLQVTASIKLLSNYLSASSCYHDKVTSGDLLNAIIKELYTAINAVIVPFELLVLLVTIIGYFIVLTVISVEMTLAGVFILVLTSIISMSWIRKSLGVGRELVETNSDLSKFLYQRIKFPRLIRLSGTELFEQKVFSELLNIQRSKLLITARLQALTEVMMEPIVVGASLLFLFFAYEVFHLQVEIIGFYLIVVLRLMPLAKAGIVKVQKIKAYTGSFDKIANYVKEMKLNKEQDVGELTPSSLVNNIELNNVSYCYKDTIDNALTDITFSIPANSITAIVGPSGSGKSTLIDLIVRIRQVDTGSICFDGVDTNTIKLIKLRSMISYVSQLPQIFDGTILDHIKYGNYKVSDDEVKKAAQLSGASGFINELENKYNTYLDEEAVNLSGGQRQRLDLARALLKHGSILIFDEPTSNLDNVSSNKIRESLLRIHRETSSTIVIVTHDLLLASIASQIVVLENGNVSSKGSHSELLEISDWYSKIYAEEQEKKI